jgi:hypothetical protein
MESIFLQINGTAMGTEMAHSYANIFMGELEKQIIQSSPPQASFLVLLHKRR